MTDRKPANLGEMNVQLDMPIYYDLIFPDGNLTNDIECHALFTYYLRARLNYEKEHAGAQIILEGEVDPEYNYRQLFLSIAQWYQVQPEHMKNYWREVDLQCAAMHLPKLPVDDKYRFSKISSIKTVN